jgi:hypothetical protein
VSYNTSSQAEDSKWDLVFIKLAKVRSASFDLVDFTMFKVCSQEFSIDDNATVISIPPDCVAPANAYALAAALSAKRRPHVTAMDLQVHGLGRIIRQSFVTACFQP